MSRPTLAKLTFAAILLGAVGFALWVQNYKYRASTLGLDQVIGLKAGQVDLKMKVNSAWEAIEPGRRPEHVLAAWIDRKTCIGEPVAIHVGYRPEPARSPGRIWLEFASFYGPIVDLRQIKIEEDLKPVHGLARVGGVAEFPLRSGMRVVGLEVVFLPDGSGIGVAVEGSKEAIGLVRQWVGEIVESMDFELPKSVFQVAPGESIVLPGWQFPATAPLFVSRQTGFESLAMHPAGVESRKLWRGEVRTVRLPEYRKPEELLQDYFYNLFSLDEVVNVSKGEASGSDTQVYMGKIEPGRDGSEGADVELAYLVVGSESSGLLFSAEVPAGRVPEVETQLAEMVKRAKQTDTAAIGPEPVNVRERFASSDLAKSVSELGGWFEVLADNTLVGFEMLNFKFDAERAVVSGLGFTYFKSPTVTYNEQEHWSFSRDMNWGVTESVIQAEVSHLARTTRYTIATRCEFDGKQIDCSVRINDRPMHQSVPQPAEFVCTGADLLLLGILAGSSASQGELQKGVRIAQPSAFIAGIKSVSLKILPPEQDRVRISALADDEFRATVSLFNRQGSWEGLDTHTGITVRRTSIGKIAESFPTVFGSAEKMIQ
jgi:hypothetical protein